MRLNYKKIEDNIKVDINKLRPKQSYKFLIENRNHNIKHLFEGDRIPERLLHQVPCHSCAAEKYTTLLIKDGFEIAQCDKCNLVYVPKILNEEHYNETYSSEAYASVVSKLGFDSHEYRKSRFGEERVSKIEQFLSSRKPSFLDVGCSTGFVVQAAQERGWNAQGIDLNTHAIHFGIENYGLNLSSDSFFDIEGSYDAVGMYDVLEHVASPSQFLQQAAKVLKPKGILHVYVPNWNSASRYILNDAAHFIWPSHHLTYFTPATLTQMIEKNDFEILEIETEGLDLYDVHWMKKEGLLNEDFNLSDRLIEILQFLTNAGGHGKNLRCIAKRK